MDKKFIHRKRMAVLEFLFLICLPLLLMLLFPKLLILRTAAMILGILYIYFMSKKYNFNKRTLGFVGVRQSTKPIKHIFLPLFSISVLVIVVAIINQSLLQLPAIQSSSLKLSLIQSILLYSVISVPLQEIIFRSFYISRLEVVTNRNWLIILFSSFTFAIIHIPFQNWVLTIGCFIVGILLAHHYLKYRNLLSVIVAHAWLGSLLVLFNTYTFNWL